MKPPPKARPDPRRRSPEKPDRRDETRADAAPPPAPRAATIARRVGLFAALALTVYIALVIPWPGLKAAYARAYRMTATALVGSFGGADVEFRQPTAATRMDTRFAVRKKGSPTWGETDHNARLTGYIPTAATIALIVATPLPWRRRLVALAAGLAAVHAFILLRLCVLALYFVSEPNMPWTTLRLGATGRSVMGALFEVVVAAPTLAYVAPLFIWLTCCIRRRDLRQWFGVRA